MATEKQRNSEYRSSIQVVERKMLENWSPSPTGREVAGGMCDMCKLGLKWIAFDYPHHQNVLFFPSLGDLRTIPGGWQICLNVLLDGPRSNYAWMTCLNEKRLLCDVIIGEISGIIKKLRMFPQLLRSYVGKVFRFSPVLPRMKVPLDHRQVSK